MLGPVGEGFEGGTGSGYVWIWTRVLYTVCMAVPSDDTFGGDV